MKNFFITLKYNSYLAYYNISDIFFKSSLLGKIIFWFVTIFLMWYIQYLTGPTIFLDGDLDKFIETTNGIEELASNANSDIYGNNINVSNPEPHDNNFESHEQNPDITEHNPEADEHNPNNNVPSSDSHEHNPNNNVSSSDSHEHNPNLPSSIDIIVDEAGNELSDVEIPGLPRDISPLLKSAILYGGIIDGVTFYPGSLDPNVHDGANNNYRK